MKRYVELGAGIGSVLLATAYNLRPNPVIAIGIEAQLQSFSLLNRTCQKIMSLERSGPYIGSIIPMLADIRQVVGKDDSLTTVKARSVDLITANPPFAPFGSGTLSKDPQIRAAKFELRGGVEEYMQVASDLLAPKGRFVCTFWSRSDQRFKEAAQKADLKIIRKVRVLMGTTSVNTPHLCTYDLVHSDNFEFASNHLEVTSITMSERRENSFLNLQDQLHILSDGSCYEELELNITHSRHQSISSPYRTILKELSICK